MYYTVYYIDPSRITLWNVKAWFDFTQDKTKAFTCSKLTIETIEQGVKYVQSEILLILNIF